MQFRVEWMRLVHLDDVVDIDWLCYDLSLTRTCFKAMLRQNDVFAQVAIWEDVVVGYNVYRHNKILQILRMGVLPNFRRKGIATRFLQMASAKGKPISARVGDGQYAAQFCLKKAGYVATVVEQDVYQMTKEFIQ